MRLMLAVVMAGVAAGCGDATNPHPQPPPPAPLLLTTIAAGYYATCGIGVNDTLYCWGDGTMGQLGVPASDTQIEDCSSIPGESPCAHEPLPVGLTAFTTLVAGGEGFCGVGPSLTPSCWGDDRYGEVGTTVADTCGNPLGPCARTPTVLALGGITQLSNGGTHACGVDQTGVGWCWGYGAYGRLGNGADTNVKAPTTVVDSLHFRSVVAGGASTCGILVDSTAACWGYNNLGSLGTSDTLSHSLPVVVSDSLHFTFIAVGIAHACALTASGLAYCWGGNTAGELGGVTSETCDFNIACATHPIPVLGAHSFTSLTLGDAFTCGIATDGSFCWGALPGTSARMGFPTSFGVQGVQGGEQFVSISAGFSHACGITSSHQAYCWGTDYHGVLGHGSKDASGGIPVLVVSRDTTKSP